MANPKESYDFKRAIWHDRVHSEFLLAYLEEGEKFRTVSERVLDGNQYIEAGNIPTGLRDLQFSFDVSLTHIPSGARQEFSRDDLEDTFKVIREEHDTD